MKETLSLGVWEIRALALVGTVIFISVLFWWLQRRAQRKERRASKRST